MKNIIN